VVHIARGGELANSNSVSVPAKVGEFFYQMCNISLKEESDPVNVLAPILQPKNLNLFILKVTKINNFPQHPQLNYSISFNDAERLMRPKSHLFWISKSSNDGPLGLYTL
jgi:hypothetical protein